MPRKTRKKKSAASQWPPLTFVRSPLFQPAPIIEQETAVANPVTAKTVPIDDLTETSWVSPQFSPKGIRMLRSSLSTLRKMNSASKNSGTHSAAAAWSKRAKFKPLRFLCDEPSAGGISVIGTKHLEPIRLETLLAQSEKNNCRLPEDPMCLQKDIHLNDRARSLDSDKENSDKVSAFVTPERTDRILRSGRRVSSSSPSPPKRKTRSSEHEMAQPSDACVPCGETAALQQHLTQDSLESVPCPASFIATPSRTDSINHEQTPELNQPCIALNNGHLSSPLAPNAKYSSSFSPIIPRKHANRLDSNLRTICHANFWLATPPRSCISSEIVLALDTPVCDYGLGLRQRQLKYDLTEEKQNAL